MRKRERNISIYKERQSGRERTRKKRRGIGKGIKGETNGEI